MESFGSYLVSCNDLNFEKMGRIMVIGAFYTNQLNLQDNWRKQHPNERMYTFIRPHLMEVLKSRIDYVWISKSWEKKIQTEINTTASVNQTKKI